MKKSTTLLLLLMTFLLLQSCAGNKEDEEKVTAEKIYTSVAASLTAQAASQPTSTLTPPATATTQATKESLVIPTLAQLAPTEISNPVGCDNSAYIGDITIEDGSLISPGKTFTKTWRVQNTGSCDWNSSYQLSFSSGEIMGGTASYVPFVIPAGKQVDLSVNLVAPTNLGTYKGYWILKNASGATFGSRLYVEIQVATNTATVTLSPTSTSVSTATSTPEPAAATLTLTPAE